MAVLFISYAHADRETAVNLERLLRESGHRVWRDDASLRPGVSIPQGIATGLAIADYLVVVATRHARESSWIAAELNLFLGDPARWNQILLLRFDDTNPLDLSPLLKLLNPKWIDFSRGFEAGRDSLLAAVGPIDDSAAGGKIADVERLRFAIELAVRAGNVAMRFYNASLHANESLDERKSATTSADRAAQNEILSCLKSDRTYRDDALVAEESPYNLEDAVLQKGYTWVVDPLDGTINFDTRIPFFCTAIGCLRNGEPHIGVVYSPVDNEVYYAMHGMGMEVWSVAKGQVQRVTSDQSTSSLPRCVVGIHISSRPAVAERFINSGLLLGLSQQVRHVRALGSGQLALAWVASGRLHAFMQVDTHLWDQVAGVVLVNCASGRTWDLRANAPWTSSTRDILAACNGKVADSLARFWSDQATRR